MTKYFAKLDENNMVNEISVVMENDAPDENTGAQFLKNLYKDQTQIWKQCDKNNPAHFRGNMASIGGEYDQVNDIFWDTKPFTSWVKNTDTWKWDPPVPFPNIIETYIIKWDEPNIRWLGAVIGEYEIKFVWNPSTLAWDNI